MQVILSTGAYLLLLTPRHRKFWSVIVYTFREQYNVPQKAVRALITFSQTPQLEGLAALAPMPLPQKPHTPLSALLFIGDVRMSYVIIHNSLCLSVVCLSSVRSLY